MTDKRVLAARHSRNEKYRGETAALLHTVAECIEWMAKALDANDNILGALAGSGIANNLPALPSNVRHTFMEYLTDEAAAGYRADQLYLASLEASDSERASRRGMPSALPETPKTSGGAVSREGET